MSRHNSQQNNNHHGSGHLWNSLTPPSTIPINNIQQQHQPQVLPVDNNNTDDIDMVPSPSTSVTSWQSCTSTETRSSQEKSADELYDQIEDLICEYMRDSERHYLQCRVLRWHLDDEMSKQFSAVIVINPPTNKD